MTAPTLIDIIRARDCGPLGILETVPVFVYGSLRPNGGGANGMMENGKVAGPWRATVNATLYYHECGAYPVLDTGQTDRLVRGDVYLMDVNSYQFGWVHEMEVGAGYDPTTVLAAIESSDGELRTAWCLTYGWNWPHHGKVIDHGDWCKAERAEWPDRVNR